jgi:hypothetical protein
MIYSDSRYANGKILKAQDSRSGINRTAVYRVFPNAATEFYNYTWVEGDRIDVVANNLLGSPSFWWRIMDFNPELVDPTNIPIGTVIRVPRG